MSGGEDWLLRPWVMGRCNYMDIKNGNLELIDIVLMNEALDVFQENQRRLAEAANRG